MSNTEIQGVVPARHAGWESIPVGSLKGLQIRLCLALAPTFPPPKQEKLRRLRERKGGGHYHYVRGGGVVRRKTKDSQKAMQMSSSKKIDLQGTLRQLFIRVYRLEIANILHTFSHVSIFNPAL
jgi:hypothetical protein